MDWSIDGFKPNFLGCRPRRCRHRRWRRGVTCLCWGVLSWVTSPDLTATWGETGWGPSGSPVPVEVGPPVFRYLPACSTWWWPMEAYSVTYIFSVHPQLHTTEKIHVRLPMPNRQLTYPAWEAAILIMWCQLAYLHLDWEHTVTDAKWFPGIRVGQYLTMYYYI